MAKFLVVYFDRYTTEDSQHDFVEADSHQEVLEKIATECHTTDFLEESEIKEHLDYLKSLYVQSDETFGSVAEQESDILIYKL